MKDISAFPQSNDRIAASKPIEDNRGMTLRDYFAAKAMQGLLANSSEDLVEIPNDEVVAFAYEMADAMLKEREK